MHPPSQENQVLSVTPETVRCLEKNQFLLWGGEVHTAAMEGTKHALK